MPVAQTTNAPSPETILAILERVGQKQEESARHHEEIDRILKESAIHREET